MKGYTLKHLRSEYIPNFNNAPYVRKADSYYKQDSVSTYKYRGVKVYTKEVLNIDKTHRCYIIDSISVSDVNDKLYTDNVRDYIDNLFNKLESKINDRPMKCQYRMSKEIEDIYYATAIDTMIGKRYTLLQKRYILGDLIKKGLTTIEALDFLKYL